MHRSDASNDWLRVKEAYEMIKTAEGRRKAREILQRHRAIASSSVIGDFVKLSECDQIDAERDHVIGKKNGEEGGGDDSENGLVEESANNVTSRAYAVDGKSQASNCETLYQYQCRCGDIIPFDVLDLNGRGFKRRG